MRTRQHKSQCGCVGVGCAERQGYRSDRVPQLRNPEAAGPETRDGPFMSSALPVAGFAIIEAADMAEAVKKISGVPCAVAHGVVEMWPLE
jgi:hypothetical protein